MVRKRPPLFRRERERAAWLLIVASISAAMWAVAEVLAWPVGIKATLAALAAVVALTVPELRAWRAAAERRERLVDRVQVRGRGGRLPYVRDTTDQQLRVHASRLKVPYITRDKQAEVDALLKQRPVLIVGHSMAGKTRLASSSVRAALPDATLLAPVPGTALRELVESGLALADTVVWLDDLDRFLTGENWLDPGLLDAVVDGGAVVVATIRRKALEVYRPRNEVRPAQWETICRFARVDLARQLSAAESRLVTATVKDISVRAAIDRYGLAEYLGAGPDALDRFDNGDTECPVGAALVRAAIDWRRAALTRFVRLNDLRTAAAMYLQNRPDVTIDDPAIDAGLRWATEKVNETVALLAPVHRALARADHDSGPMFEAFDYLVDVLVERASSADRVQRDLAAIPVPMWGLAFEAASRGGRRDVEIAASAEFVDRAKELRTLTSWLAMPLASSAPPLFVVTGVVGTGKTAILRRLQQLGDPTAYRLVAKDLGHPRVNVPPFDLVLSARGQTGCELLAAMCAAAGAAPVLDETDYGCKTRLLDALSALSLRQRSLIVVIDDLDQASDPEQAMYMLVELARAARELPLRLLVATQQRPGRIEGVVEVLEAAPRLPLTFTRGELAMFPRLRR